MTQLGGWTRHAATLALAGLAFLASFPTPSRSDSQVSILLPPISDAGPNEWNLHGCELDVHCIDEYPPDAELTFISGQRNGVVANLTVPWSRIGNVVSIQRVNVFSWVRYPSDTPWYGDSYTFGLSLEGVLCAGSLRTVQAAIGGDLRNEWINFTLKDTYGYSGLPDCSGTPWTLGLLGRAMLTHVANEVEEANLTVTSSAVIVTYTAREGAGSFPSDFLVAPVDFLLGLVLGTVSTALVALGFARRKRKRRSQELPPPPKT